MNPFAGSCATGSTTPRGASDIVDAVVGAGFARLVPEIPRRLSPRDHPFATERPCPDTEAGRQAQADRGAVVRDIANRTLFPLATPCREGDTVPDKPRGVLTHVGRRSPHIERRNQIMGDNNAGLHFKDAGRSSSPVAAHAMADHGWEPRPDAAGPLACSDPGRSRITSRPLIDPELRPTVEPEHKP